MGKNASWATDIQEKLFIDDTAGVIVGGTVAGARNIISANPSAGIGLYGGSTGALVQGNFIGTDQTRANPLGNGNGIQIDGGSGNNTNGGSVAARWQCDRLFRGDRRRRRLNSRRRQRDPPEFNLLERQRIGINLGSDGVT